jgi:Mg2+/Co2+ transporter CorB
VIINLAGLILLILSLAVDGLLAATGNAFVNSHPRRLREEEQKGRFGAATAVRVAEDSTKIILSMRVMRGFIRIVTIGFAALAFSDLFITAGSMNFVALAGILVVFGIVIGLIEFLAESFALRSPNIWAVRTSYMASLVIFLARPITLFVLRMGGRVIGMASGEDQPLVTEEQIMTLVDG